MEQTLEKQSLIKDKTNFLFLHKLLKAVGDSIVKVFIPLIIFRACNNMYLVILFACLHYFLSGVLNIVLRRFLQRKGVIAIFLSIAPIIAIQFVLAFCPMVWYVVVLLAVLNALNQVLYSVPINLLFAFNSIKVLEDFIKCHFYESLNKIVCYNGISEAILC